MITDYEIQEIEGFNYAIPAEYQLRKKTPPLIVVMNDNCTSCAGSPMCITECPVDCIHILYDDTRPTRVYIENDRCIGCMNCLSYNVRPKDIGKTDIENRCEEVNQQDLFSKNGVCPWDSIEIHPFDEGVERSREFYSQPSEIEGPAREKAQVIKEAAAAKAAAKKNRGKPAAAAAAPAATETAPEAAAAPAASQTATSVADEPAKVEETPAATEPAVKFGLVFGSTNGNTSAAADIIMEELKDTGLAALTDIADISPSDLEGHEILLIGCPTWHIGELQDDWNEAFPDLDGVDLKGTKVGFFGCGDQVGYSDNFQDALGILRDKFIECGAICDFGFWPTDGYDYIESKGEVDGKFAGLALDDDNQADQTEDRVKQWCAQIRDELSL